MKIKTIIRSIYNMAEQRRKDDSFTVIDVDGKRRFKCSLCGRTVASKQNINLHLHSAHKLSPVKRVKKRYVDDPQVDVPRRTANRWKKYSVLSGKKLAMPNTSDEVSSTDNGDEISATFSLNVPLDVDHSMLNKTELLELENIEKIVESESFSENTCDAGDAVDINKNGEELHLFGDNESDMNEMEYESDMSSISDTNFSASNSDSNLSTSSCNSDDTDNDEGDNKDDGPCEEQPTQHESMCLSVLSCFLKHNLSASASKDIFNTLKSAFHDADVFKAIEYDDLWKLVESDTTKEFHYCELCEELFPPNENVYRCSKAGCSGLRYKGSNQTKKGRQPRTSFLLADVKKQLQSLIQSNGIWEDILKNKTLTFERHGTNLDDTGIITDICDGNAYRKLLEDGRFLSGSENTNLTAVFNTDGINLYSSSKVELWPIFLTINELSPETRFARHNMILAAIWQGKGKPPFKPYLEASSKVFNTLYSEGISAEINGNFKTIKLGVICATVDLPAKAGILNMTQYNGSCSCITCEEPGKVVKQGKGHARCFPYRSEEQKYPERSQQTIKYAMENGSSKKPCKGFKGFSGISTVESLILPSGVVPDYMHCVLLGITKTLMYKWFSSTNSKESYFIGKDLKVISKRLQNIKPPDSIERLPRDLEKHYANLKATELQCWLLYYALPCLQDILPNTFMEHFAQFSEAIYILLGDIITAEEIKRAEYLLRIFYKNFTKFYPEGSCGLNVHNAGAHLVDYVKLWGPLWAWSCFGFEDSNAMILQAVHGTGNVTRQIVRFKEAQALIRGIISRKLPNKLLKEAANCNIVGSVQTIKASDGQVHVILEHFKEQNISNYKKAQRIVKDGQKFYSAGYNRMKRRMCNVVLLQNKDVVIVNDFILCLSSSLVYAVVTELAILSSSFSEHFEAGKHLIPVKVTENVKIISVDDIVDKLFYICTNPRPEFVSYICRMPNVLGRSVFK